jgi:transcriptional regulator with XRE-family HTH domain
MTLSEIGIEIRKARKEKKITLLQLGNELGMSVATLSQLESGSVNELGIRKVLRILDKLDLMISTKPVQYGYTFEDALEDQRIESLNMRG